MSDEPVQTVNEAAPPAEGFDVMGLIDDIMHRPDEAYARVIVALLIATGIVIALHFIVAALSRFKGPGRRRRWSFWEVIVYLGLLVTVALLGATAFYAVLAHGHMNRWPLFLHLGGAGGFVVVFTLVAITWAQPNRFTGRASKTKPTDTTSTDANAPSSPPKFSGLSKASFWIILLSGVATAGTMLVSMLPIMDTETMLQVLNIHRYSGLVLVIAMIVHLYSVWLGRLGWR